MLIDFLIAFVSVVSVIAIIYFFVALAIGDDADAPRCRSRWGAARDHCPICRQHDRDRTSHG